MIRARPRRCQSNGVARKPPRGGQRMDVNIAQRAALQLRNALSSKLTNHARRTLPNNAHENARYCNAA
eukprot:3753755-Lingulodinium_polyedra.AAC.1